PQRVAAGAGLAAHAAVGDVARRVGAGAGTAGAAHAGLAAGAAVHAVGLEVDAHVVAALAAHAVAVDLAALHALVVGVDLLAELAVGAVVHHRQAGHAAAALGVATWRISSAICIHLADFAHAVRVAHAAVAAAVRHRAAGHALLVLAQLPVGA